ncbi:MAG TPA: transglutaminase-like domain-containing protein [Anaerolineaceae bacterium]
MNNLYLTFREELNQQTINLPRAALLFARAIAYPSLDVEDYLRRIYRLAEDARPALAQCTALSERVDALAEFLFNEIGFKGNREDYYDPRNSYLNCVLDRKLGIPISLACLYVSVAQRLGLPAYGIGLPGHFIVGVYHQGQEIYLDPFDAGVRLSIADCSRLVQQSTGKEDTFQARWLAAVKPSDMLARMLTNLCNAYIQREDWHSAIPTLQHLLMVQPETDYHLRDLGYLYMYNGSLRLSAQYLEEYLRRAPRASDFDHVLTSLKIVAGRLALWN